MSIGREEAVRVLRDWFSEQSLLRCNMVYPLFVCTFRGRVFQLTDEKVVVLSDDHESELVLMLSPEIEFGYGAAKDNPESAVYGNCLAAVLSPRTAPDKDFNYIGFTLIKVE